MYKYFKNSSYTVTSLNQERKKYFLKYHPDRGGKASDFNAMNEEYKIVLKSIENGTFQQKVSEYSPEQYITKYKASDFYPKNPSKKLKPKKAEIIASFLKKCFQNKIFYRIVFFFTATLWYPVALNFGLSECIIALLYSLPLVFAIYTRIHIFAWFMNLVLSGFIIAKIQVTFMMPYFNFWFFGLIIYAIIYGIATTDATGGAPTKERWDELGKKIKGII